MKNLTKKISKLLIITVFTLLNVQPAICQFTPGEGGSIPALPEFTATPGKVGCLRVSYSQRWNNVFTTGTRATVDLEFFEPSRFGADSYTLQYCTDFDKTWRNYQSNGADLTSTWTNFSLDVYADYYFRLLLNGGPKNGYTSNEVYAPISNIETYFGGWGMDESMFITGVMAPWIGRGLDAEFTVKKLADGTVVPNCLTYQWYRVNPLTFEMTVIPKADTLRYITTLDDAGYYLCLRATGDGTNAGGFAQVFSLWENLIPNKAFVNNVNENGFTLNLYKTVEQLVVNDLVLYDSNYDTIHVSAVTKGTNGAVYNISAKLDITKSPFRLENKSTRWKIASEFMMMDLMQGVSIEYISGIDKLNVDKLNIYPIPAKNEVNIKAETPLTQVDIFNAEGKLLQQSEPNSNEATLNTSSLCNGIYMLRIHSTNGSVVKKIQILK